MHYLNTTELAKLFRVAQKHSKTHHMALLCGFFTGARVSQVLKLRGEDIFESNGSVVIKIRPLKGGVERIHKLHFDARSEFDMSPLLEMARRTPRALIFGGLSRQYTNLRLKDYCEEAGIHTDFGHFHMLRHSCAMKIWEGTKKLGTITHFLGHASAATATQYLAENDGQEAQLVMDGI